MMIWVAVLLPRVLNSAIIVKLSEKGDMSNCDNWREIMLLAIARKLISWILLKRMSYT